MQSRTRHILVSLVAALFVGVSQPSGAQTPGKLGPSGTVGLPGCGSDVAVAASRTRISFTSEGRDVPALLYEPQGGRRAGSALVLLHGRDVQEDLGVLDNHAIQLASRGFAVIVPFYLEARRELDNPSEVRAAHQIWRRVALDAAAAVAIEMEIAPRQVVLWGHTRGGGVALAAALEPGSPVGGAVGVTIGGSPQDDADGAGRPFLLIHPARSSLMPPREVRNMGDRIQERGGEVERVEIAADFGQFERDDWCRTMDSTRGLLERVAASPPAS